MLARRTSPSSCGKQVIISPLYLYYERTTRPPLVLDLTQFENVYDERTPYFSFLLLPPIWSSHSSVVCEIMNNCMLGERKNMNLPGAIVDLPTLTEKDIDDLQNFGLAHGVDYIAASFVRKPEDIDTIRHVLGEEGAHIKVP